MASLALPSFVSWQWRSHFPSPLQQWEGGILITILPEIIPCVSKHTGEEEKNTRDGLAEPISNEAVHARR